MKNNGFRYTLSFMLFIVFVVFSFFVTNAAGGEPILSKGQAVYVPVYSHILVGGGKRQLPFDLSINLSIRNTDPKNAITIISANYYDSDGNIVKQFIDKPLVLKPMGSTYLYIMKSDASGGWGANYIIKWESEILVNEPIIESINYGSRGTHTISFVSRGKVIKE